MELPGALAAGLLLPLEPLLVPGDELAGWVCTGLLGPAAPAARVIVDVVVTVTVETVEVVCRAVVPPVVIVLVTGQVVTVV